MIFHLMSVLGSCLRIVGRALLATAALSFPTYASSSANYSLGPTVIAGEGGRAAGAALISSNTLGESGVGTVSSTNYRNQLGFWAILAGDACSAQEIGGTVFYDYNQLFDNTVNGLDYIPSGINAVLVRVNADMSEVVVDSAVIPPRGAANVGQYGFVGSCSEKYYVMLANTSTFTVGSPPPVASSLPGGYVSTGENIGSGVGSDGTVDGKSAEFGPPAVDVVKVNFGIIRFRAVTID